MMANDDLEKLRNEFIVDQNKYAIDDIPEQVKKLLRFVKVGSEGKVFIEKRDMSPDVRLKLILVARFLASKLQNEIKADISIEELSQYSYLDKDQVRARMSKIVGEKFANREKRGVFSVLPFKIRKFIDELDTL
jgi:hypothetical protein